ncbi:MAG: ATP-dependent helicase [Lachnospiraceae bacterium]
MNFNHSQKQAIEHCDGPALVLAGPGSGKTAVVTNRVRMLIEKYHVNPANILVITFTKAAAMEMKERFRMLMNRGGIPVTFGTFHGIYFMILKHAYNYRVEDIITAEEQFALLHRIVNAMHLEYENEKEFLGNILSEISRVKGDRIDLNHYYSANCGQEVFRKIYEEYDNNLKRQHKIDFDDMILSCYELLSRRKDVLKAWQEKFQYILIDEFQDINNMQYAVIRMLAEPQNNLFIVGDDDQSIYGFRGSRPEIMLNFPKDYPKCRVMELDVNYRCQENILAKAVKLIGHNEKRYEKNTRAFCRSKEPVYIREYPDVYDEAIDVIDRIKDYHDEGMNYNDMAILTRTNEGARYILGKLMEHNIPFRAKDSIPSLYSHWIVKNVLAYVDMALGNRDRNLFITIMNRPKRYISRDVLNSPVVDFDEIRMEYLNSRSWMLERIDRLEEDLHVLSNLNPFGAINYIRRGIGYDDFLREYAQEMDLNPDDLFEVINELQEASREFNDYFQWFRHIDQYEEMLKEKNKKREKDAKEQDGVNIVTMHSAKGLEYETVFVLDVNEGIIPYKKAVLNNEIEEERRMFYVAMTRAKEHLHLCSVDTRFNKKMEISRFLNEIQE